MKAISLLSALAIAVSPSFVDAQSKYFMRQVITGASAAASQAAPAVQGTSCAPLVASSWITGSQPGMSTRLIASKVLSPETALEWCNATKSSDMAGTCVLQTFTDGSGLGKAFLFEGTTSGYIKDYAGFSSSQCS